MEFFSNKAVSEDLRLRAGELLGESPLFCIASDLTQSSEYGARYLFFARDRLVCLEKAEDPAAAVLFDEIEEAKVKRMYGNAVFRCRLKDGSSENLLRFSYAAADISDAAADFVETVRDEGFSEDALAAVKATFDKQRCFCPKCGRKLPSPDAPCINCSGKGKTFSKLAAYVRPQTKNLVLCLILSAVTTALSLVPTYITKLMVDDVLPDRDMDKLVKIILTLVGVYVVQFTLTGFRQYRLRCASDGIITGLKKDIFAKAQYLPMRFYDKTSTGSVINRINSDTAVVQNFILRISQEAIVQFFTMVGIIVIMLSMNWRLALLALCPIPLVVFVARRFGRLIGPKYRRLWRRSSAISSMLTDSIPGIRVIKAFSNEKSVIGKFDRYCSEWEKEDKAAGLYAAIFPTLITFFVTCGSILIWFIGGRWTVGGSFGVTSGMLISFISYAGTFYNPVNFFANLGDSYESAIASAEKILDILDSEPESDFGDFRDEEPLHGKIEFKNLSFSFDKSKKVLSDINLTIEPGDIVGIVGTTGSGKSTLINLLMRYYDDYDGQILMDGRDVKDIDMRYYRSQIGFVQQEPLMFRDTVFNNIAYGSGEVHVEQVLHAAEVANAHGFISKMPDA
ncbi:MAG: ABC transporter ATP-binding protein/permease, partial [Clostridia bacterium]|nr:ABC transporter ATP-binding protein/permease [Clostridia bacterium]